MKPIQALPILGAVLGALAAGPAVAQSLQDYPPVAPSPQSQARSEAIIPGGDLSVQAVQPQFLAKVQQELQSQGYYRGPIDGVYGDQTRAALARWQQDQGLQPTGQLNAQTLTAFDIQGMAAAETQQAEIPPAAGDASNIETLRDEKMSSPNVEGESVPKRPGTGAAAPGQSPESLEQPPRD